MNEWLKKFMDQIKNIWGKWTTVQKIIFFGIIGVTIIAIALLIVFSKEPSMVTLIGTPVKDENQLAQIVTKLDEEAPGQYKIREDNIILVKDEKTARRLRTMLILNDLLPQADPWEIFDVEKWTLTDFEREVNLRRAISKSIEQHIKSLDGIDAVSVIIDMPKDSFFAEDQKPFTASVKLTPSPGSKVTENRDTLQGIERLIIMAVSGLAHENIVMTDHRGKILNNWDEFGPLDELKLINRQLEQKKTLENQYKNEIIVGLKHIFGADRVEILKLDIDLDISKESSTSKVHSPILMKPDNPNTPFDDSVVQDSLLISSQVENENFQGTGFVPEGPPGMEGQTPPEYKDLSNLVGKYDRKLETMNHAINEKNIAREERPWDFARITVGVAIDGYWEVQYDNKGNVQFEENNFMKVKRNYIPVSDEQLTKAENIIKDAIGYNKARGDSVTVEHLAFDRRAEQYMEDEKYRRQKQLADTMLWVLVGVGAIAVTTVLFRVTSKYLERRRREKEEELARQHQAMREAALRSAEEQGVDVQLSVEERARLEMQENAVNMAREHPEDVAQLIRSWLLEE